MDILLPRNTSSVIVALVIGVAPCALDCSLLYFFSPGSHCPWLTRLHTGPELCNLTSFLHMTCLLSKGSFGPRLLPSYRDKSRSCPAHLSLFLTHASRVGIVMDSSESLHSVSASFYLPKANLSYLVCILWVGHLPGHFWPSVFFSHADIDMVISTTLPVPHTPCAF